MVDDELRDIPTLVTRILSGKIHERRSDREKQLTDKDASAVLVACQLSGPLHFRLANCLPDAAIEPWFLRHPAPSNREDGRPHRVHDDRGL